MISSFFIDECACRCARYARLDLADNRKWITAAKFAQDVLQRHLVRCRHWATLAKIII